MDLESTLVANRSAVDQLIAAAEKAGNNWTTPRAPGKWSPSQVVEHVARSLEEAATMAQGGKSNLPDLPVFVRPLARVFFNRVIKKNGFSMKAKTNPPMDPMSGPDSPETARERLLGALGEFETACRNLAADGKPMPSSAFGNVPVEDYAKFMEIHTIHHTAQIPLSETS